MKNVRNTLYLSFLFLANRINYEWKTGQLEKTWHLVPESSAKVFPSYIPKMILEDYNEACKIVNLSPKASATLARRCLQGMIRNFFKIVKPADFKGNWTLFNEIDAIKNEVEPEVWEAIDGVRGMGNVGAHMQKDIDIRVDVEPEEAIKLIALIELLIEEWYISRDLRQQKVKAVIEIAKEKGVSRSVK